MKNKYKNSSVSLKNEIIKLKNKSEEISIKLFKDGNNKSIEFEVNKGLIKGFNSILEKDFGVLCLADEGYLQKFIKVTFNLTDHRYFMDGYYMAYTHLYNLCFDSNTDIDEII